MAGENIASAPAERNPTIIYGLLDPTTSELRYVGKTRVGLGKRLAKHLDWWRYRPAKMQTHVSRWVGSLDGRGLRPRIVELEAIEAGGDWQEAERFWIANFRFLGARLANLTDGGEGVEGYKVSPERGAAHSAMMRRLWADPAYRERQSRAHRGFVQDPEIVARRVSKTRGKKRSPEATAATAARLRRHWADPEFRARAVAGIRAVAATPEWRAKVGAGQRGKPKPNLRGKPKSAEHRAALSVAAKGRVFTDEHKARLKASARRRWDAVAAARKP